MLTQGAGLHRPQTSLARLGGRLRNWGRLSVARLPLKDVSGPAWASPRPPTPFTPPSVAGNSNCPQSQELHLKCTNPECPDPH